MNRVGLAFVAFLLHATPQSLLGTATVVTAISISHVPAQAQNKEAIAKVAKAITVRIEGAIQGSGVIVKREGKRHTVLTAWHVVSDHLPGEELAIYTHDGKSHQLLEGSIQRLGQVDMAVLTFSSPATYEVASIGDVKEVKYNDRIYVAGFPFNDLLNLRYEPGEVVANADVGIDQGYQLLYSNQTIRGMSGGSLLNSQGKIIGIHGRGERDEKRSSGDFIVKTGINQGVPIHYFNQFVRGLPVVIVDAIAKTPDDYLALAQASIGEPGREQTVIRLANQALKIKADSEEAYFMRAHARNELGHRQKAILDYGRSIDINGRYVNAFNNRGVIRQEVGDIAGAIADFKEAAKINPKAHSPYINLGYANYLRGNYRDSILYYSNAIEANPRSGIAYNDRGAAKIQLEDHRGAIGDFNKAIFIDPRLAIAFMNRGTARHHLYDHQGAISDLGKAIELSPENPTTYYSRGNTKMGTKDFQGAIFDYSKTIEISPNYLKAHLNRGVARYEISDLEGAISDYNQELAIDSRSASAYVNRGNAKDQLKRYAEAIDDFNKALEISPKLAAAYGNRANTKLNIGDYAGSCSDFKRAAKLGHSHFVNYLNSSSGYWCSRMP